MRHLKRFNEELTFLEERHNALDTKQLREVYFEVTIKS